MTAADRGPGPDPAARLLAALFRLSLEAWRSPDRRTLAFRLLNDSIALCPYSRASLWETGRKRPTLMGVSGQPAAATEGPFADDWGAFVAAIGEPARARVLEPLAAETEARLGAGLGGLRLLWLPLPGAGRPRGLLLERWGGREWSEEDLRLLLPLAEAFGAAWDRFRPLAERFAWPRWLASRRRRLCLAAVLAWLLFLHPFRLRVVAPCEVVAKEPFVAAAPMEGVVGEIRVRPGQRVAAGEVLFIYDRRTADQELEIARQQVSIIQTQLDQADAQAFATPGGVGEVAVLRHRLAQAQTRFELARSNHERLEVRSERAGLAVVQDPEAWRGRPVRIGERVVTVVDPDTSRVRVWIPESDDLRPAPGVEGSVVLRVAAERSWPVMPVTVCPVAAPGPAGAQSFLVEADWVGGAPAGAVGLKGSAVLYGPRQPIFWRLLHRPIAWFRGWAGL